MNWKRALLIGLGWGLGTALGLAIIVGGFLWYENRPRPAVPPKPWDSSSIKVEYDYASTEGDKNEIVIVYTLENLTDFDYRIVDGTNVTTTAKLRKENELFPFSAEGRWIDYPIFLPAKKRVSFKIHLHYPYGPKEKDNADLDERRKYRAGVENYISEKLGNLDGFDILDETNRNEIIFPAGWKHSK